MKIYTSDNKMHIEAGSRDRFLCVYKTALSGLSEDDQDFLMIAMDFLQTGMCLADDAQITARQLEIMRKRFRKLPAGRAVRVDAICGAGESCAEAFLTADGKNLLDELIGLLKYADSTRVDTLVE